MSLESWLWGPEGEQAMALVWAVLRREQLSRSLNPTRQC